MQSRNTRNGSALVTCTIFLVIFIALAVGLATLSGANVQIADNQRQASQALAGAESGLDVVRFWLSRVRIPSVAPPSEYLSRTITSIRDDLSASGVTNLVLNVDGSIPPVTLDPVADQRFAGQISADPCDATILRVRIAGTSHDAARTVQVDFRVEPYRFPIFDYGIATKGALQFPQNPTLTGAADNWEADIYVESAASILAVQVLGNANFDGNIDICNPLATVDFQGAVQIAGETGPTAIDNHVNIGADPVEFPVPQTSRFEAYATGSRIDPNTNLSSSMTLVNALIKPGVNPTFLGNITIQGILFIKSPNVVRFTRNVAQQGIIVADGNVASPGTNQISFEGNFSSSGYPSGPQFDAIRAEVGSSILAPGFAVSFTGNFSSVNGVMAANDLYFASNASAIVKGTLISYSSNPTRVEGNISMEFDRSAMVEIPSGFDLLRVLEYDPQSYAMVF